VEEGRGLKGRVDAGFRVNRGRKEAWPQLAKRRR
jgi:hypothetical protein